MINPNEIKAKAEKKYIPYLQSLLEGKPFEPIDIRGDKSYSKDSLAAFEKELLLLNNQSKQKKGYGYSLKFQKVKTKYLGSQDLPVSIYFASEKDFLKYLAKEKEVVLLRNNYQKITNEFPELKAWTIKNLSKVIQNETKWDGILKVCRYFKNNPQPYLYLRELPIKVHTKFIENNKGLLKELLDILITEHINQQEKIFEKRFNLKYAEPQIRFRLLDQEISQKYLSGIDDLAITISQFKTLQLPINKVLVVENKTTLYTTLTLPNMKGTIAILGSGYGVSNLKNVDWLTNIDLLYWGDIDAQGFEILSQFREYYPQTKSILMDIETFEKFFENDQGTLSNIDTQLNLTETEQQLYMLLKINNWRLEQEKIPLNYVNMYFENNN